MGKNSQAVWDLKLPPAYAVLNPKQPGCSFPFKELAGVGVAFNLIIALRSRFKDCGYFANGNIPNLKGYTDIVALGTIADMVPLIDENRILVKYGLEELTPGRRPGVRALKEVSGLNNIVKAGSVGFQLAPRINAAGRLDNASTGVRLLIADDDKEASDIARELNRENIERQRLEGDMLSEALATIQAPGFNIQNKKAVVLAKDGWHPGIIGIVASRIVGRYHRPTIIISLKDGIGKGSARGIKGIDMLGNLKECSGFLDKYGGHKMAAGFSIREENVKLFESAFYTLADGKLSFEDLIPDISLDSYIKLDEINEKIITEIEGLAPFGLANPEPLLAIRDVSIVQSEVVGKNHLSLQIKAGDIGFQGKNLAVAVDVWERMLKGNVTIFFGLAGAMVPAGMRKVIVHLIKNRFIDCLVSTGANLFHDIHETLGKYHYQGHTMVADVGLKDEGIDRIYDVFAVEEEFERADRYCYRFAKTLEKRPYTTREFLSLLGKRLSEGVKEDGILTAAYKAGVPVYCPAIGDSSIGIGLAMKPEEDNFIFDVIGDVKETALIAAEASNTGVVYVGGGTPKNFIQQTEVTAGLMGRDVWGHKYAVKITADAPHWGGLS